MLKELEGYNWAEVFKYANPELACPGMTTSTSSFTIEDVEFITDMEEGENDGPDWIMYGKLKDGRYFSIAAGCDYTGWG